MGHKADLCVESGTRDHLPWMAALGAMDIVNRHGEPSTAFDGRGSRAGDSLKVLHDDVR